MSSTNFGSIPIFTSCVVGTSLVIYYVGEFFVGRDPIKKRKKVYSLVCFVYSPSHNS